jgi:hypothetical protein
LKSHPFKPFIVPTTEMLIIGSLPPEGASMYFSYSHQIRLWDILFAIWKNQPTVGSGGWKMENKMKYEILYDLKLGIADIILDYQRLEPESNKDKDILPISYYNLVALATATRVKKFLFVYESAALWFVHSFTQEIPMPYLKIKSINISRGKFHHPLINDTQINCYLLPNPLSRGRIQGETVNLKRQEYEQAIAD